MGFFDKIKQGLSKTASNISQVFTGHKEINEDFYEELEESLILADLGMDTTMEAMDALREKVKAEKLKTIEEAKAAHTFRAAAADQLEIWAGRAGVDIIRQDEGADPAAVVFDAIAAAKARKSDVILCDTAGRLHNKQNLMNELGKIARIIERELPNAAKEVLLVLDGTTGQNGLVQARQFKEIAGVTGMVMTKLDGTAKGGIVVAVAHELQIPVKYIGVGEQMDDLMPFEAAAFAEALV